MTKKAVSKAVLKRLPTYLAYLKSLPEEECTYISATALANALELGEVQVRKDLAMVSDGGKPKVGYLREALMQDLEHFLCYDYTDHAIVVGTGKLGQALMDYSGFETLGLYILAGFDRTPEGKRVESGKRIMSMDALPGFIKANRIRIAILTVPTEHAQSVCDQLVACGIQAIWNFAPVRLEVPEDILVQNENLASSLAVICRHMHARSKDI